MKKLLLILLVVAIVALTPKFISYPVEARYLDYLQQLDANPYLTVTDISYQANWFDSSINYQIKLNSFDPEDNYSIEVTEYLRHGPVIVDDQLRFGLAYSNAHLDFKGFELAAQDVERFNELVTIRTLITFTGNAESTVDMKGFEFTEDEASIEIKPAKLITSLSADGIDIKGDGSWQGMVITAADGGAFTFGEMLMEFDAKVISGNLFDGSAVSVGSSLMSIESMRFNEPSMAMPILFEGFNATGVNTADQGLLNSVMTMNLAKLDVVTEQFEQVKMTMHIDNLSIEAMTEFNRLNIEAQQALATNSEPDIDMEPFKKLLPTMLDANPQFKISELSAQVSDGEIYADFSMSLDKDKFDIDNMMTLAKAFVLEANLKVPETYLAKKGMAPMIQAYQQQQMLTIEDGNVMTRLQYINGQMLMNDKALPFGQL